MSILTMRADYGGQNGTPPYAAREGRHGLTTRREAKRAGQPVRRFKDFWGLIALLRHARPLGMNGALTNVHL
jgi:hypothetical protein